MDNETIRNLILIGQFLVNCAIGVYVHLATRDKATNERISKVEEELGDQMEKHAVAIARLDEATEKAPSHADLSKVYDTLNKLSNTVHQLVGENRGQSDTLRLILNRITEKGMA